MYVMTRSPLRDPAQDFATLGSRINRMLSDVFAGSDWQYRDSAASSWVPPVDVLEEQAARIRSDRNTLGENLRALKGVTVFPSQANFFLIRVPDAERTYQALKQQNVLVRNLNPGIRDCLRVTVGTPEENRILLSALKESL